MPFSRRYSTLCRLGLVLLLAKLAMHPVEGHAAKPPRQNAPGTSRWHIIETENFRLLNYGRRAIDERVGKQCEQVRAELVRHWSQGTADRWVPKCDVVLHPNDASYDREIGPGGQNTIASALVDRLQGRISVRRIDVRATRADWCEAALGHELTHVVLADRFDQEALPRWLDEGMAILADSQAKRRQHAVRARADISQGNHFSLAELLLLTDYPPAHRWGTFYDQSAALVEYLVTQRGHEGLLQFAELAQTHGYENAFRRVYSMNCVELERRWQGSLLSSSPGPRQRISAQTTGWAASDNGG